MKTLLITLILLLCALPASAQRAKEYYIKPRYNTNLRAAPSTDSDRVELVSSKQVLIVVGEVGDWFKIDWFGSEAYMAKWVPHRVVGGGAEISTQYADVSCRGPRYYQDAKYAFEGSFGGYWVFTNRGRSTCDVSARSPLSAFPAEAFVDNQRVIEVDGSPEIAAQIVKSLEGLEQAAPDWYAFVTNAIDKIIGYEPDSELDTESADAYLRPHNRTMYVSRPAAFRTVGPQEEQLMAVFVHEACHVYQVELKMNLHGDEFEVMCHALEMDFADAIEIPWLKRLPRTLIVHYLYAEDFLDGNN